MVKLLLIFSSACVWASSNKLGFKCIEDIGQLPRATGEPGFMVDAGGVYILKSGTTALAIRKWPIELADYL